MGRLHRLSCAQGVQVMALNSGELQLLYTLLVKGDSADLAITQEIITTVILPLVQARERKESPK